MVWPRRTSEPTSTVISSRLPAPWLETVTSSSASNEPTTSMPRTAVRSTTGATATSMRSGGRLLLLWACAFSTAFLPQAAKINVAESINAMMVFLRLAGFMIISP